MGSFSISKIWQMLVDRKCKFREWKLEPLEIFSLGATSKDPTAFQFGQNKDGVEMQRYSNKMVKSKLDVNV